MITRFINRLLGKPDTDTSGARAAIALGKRQQVGPGDHGIDAQLLDERAVQVVKTLQQAGYEAYIVGGAVRDLLVGRRPKDFDVATHATPEEVKAQFRRAFIIGRRFRIVHVVFGRGRDHEVIEVSTFRAYLDASAAQQVQGNERTARSELAGKSHVVDASGRLLRDNVWGPQIEDAARRDFTINAMYYDPVTGVVVDYHNGLKDLKARTLRMIGDPATRYREDPVRVLRVVRFAAKLGFGIEPHTRRAIKAAVPLLDAVPQSRLFDEMIKLLQTGHGLSSLEVLMEHGLLHLFPILEQALAVDVAQALDQAHAQSSAQSAEQRSPQRAHRPAHGLALPEPGSFVHLALSDTDRRVAEDKAVAPSFLLACLLWREVQDRWQAAQEQGEGSFAALQQAIDAVFDARIGDISGRGKLAADMREIWQMQPRFERRTGNGPRSLIEQPRFRAGFDFLRLRADAGQVAQELAEWWEDFSLGTEDDREALLATVREQQKPRRVAVRPRTSRAESSDPADEAAVDEADDSAQASASAPKRRRRRRRKPMDGAAPETGPGGAGAES